MAKKIGAAGDPLPPKSLICYIMHKKTHNHAYPAAF